MTEISEILDLLEILTSWFRGLECSDIAYFMQNMDRSTFISVPKEGFL